MHTLSSRKLLSKIVGILLALSVFIFSASIRADNISTWDGGGASDSWSDNVNWLGDVAPLSSSDTEIIFAGGTRLTPQQNSNFNLNVLDFATNSAAFTLGGSGTLNFQTNSGNSLPAIVNASAPNQIINQKIAIIPSFGVYSLGGSPLTFGGVISGSGPLVKQGSGSVVFNVANTYTAGTIVNAGTLKLDFNSATAPTNNIVTAGTILQLNGGALSIQGRTSTTNAQTFASLNLDPGANTINAISGSGGTVNLTLGAITRYVGGTLNFITPTSGAITATNANTNGILGGYAIFAGNDWAAVTSGNISRYAAYTNNTWAAGNNTTVTSSSSVPANSTTNSLRFGNSAALTLTLSGTNTITSGGLLVSSAVGNNLSQINGGSLAGANSADLIVYQNNTANGLTIGSSLVNNGGATSLTKSGPGLLILTGTSNLTGLLRVYEGTLTFASGSSWSNPVASGTPQGGITRGGTTLNINGTIDLTNQEFDISTSVSSAATVNLNSGGMLTAGQTAVGYIGTGIFNQTGGTHSTGFLRMSAAYSGSSIPVANGTYNLSGGQLNASRMLIGDQAPALFNQTAGTTTTSYLSVDASGTFSLSGTNSIVTASTVAIGGNGGGGTFTQMNGSLATAGDPNNYTGYLSVGDYSAGAYNFNGGTLTTDETDIGYDGTGVFNQTGGTHTVRNSGSLYLGRDGGSSGIYNLEGSGILLVGNVLGGSGTSTFNFNGGILQAAASNANFLNGLTTVNVRAGGAKINTNGFDLTLGQVLIHSSINGDPAGDGGLTKTGLGTLTLNPGNTYNGLTLASAGTLINLGTLLGNVEVANSASFTGAGTIKGSLTVDSGGFVGLSAGTLSVNGGVTNSGTMRFDHGASLAVANGSVLINHGLLDIISGSFTAPAGFSNDGIVLDATVVRAKQITLGSGGVTVSIVAYPAHTYQLQRSSTLNPANFTDVPNVPPQTNPASAANPVTFAFNDTNPPAGSGFYRLRVDP